MPAHIGPELPQHSILNTFIVRILPYCCQFFLTQFSTLGWAHRFNIKFTFNPVRPFYFVRVIFRPTNFFSVQSLPRPSCFCAQLCSEVATIFCSALWTPAYIPMLCQADTQSKNWTNFRPDSVEPKLAYSFGLQGKTYKARCSQEPDVRRNTRTIETFHGNAPGVEDGPWCI
jgi:hypothetical protein